MMTEIKLFAVCAGLTALSAGALADILGDLPDSTHAWSVHDPNRPRPPVVDVGANGVPSDAAILLDGTEETYRANWRSCKKDAVEPQWKLEGGVIASCDGSIETVRKFGDCQLHVEWCAPDDENPQHGNSGVYLMGLYEVQIINSHEIAPGKYHTIIRSADEQAGSVYGQKPPLVNPIRRPGEWQTYDIVFHQPIHSATGELVRPGTMTLFFNGVLVQDNREIEGPTLYMKRASDRVHAERAPLRLQDHNGNVRFRNIWIRELASPWSEDLVSGTSVASRKAVAEQRVKNAQRLLDGLKDLPSDYDRLVSALEMLTYSSDEQFLHVATKLANAEAEVLPYLDAETRKLHIARLRRYLGKMREFGCLPADWKLTAALNAPREPKISMFANAVERYAKAKNLSIAEAARLFYAAGVRGFDSYYGYKLLPELVNGPLKPASFYGSVNFAESDGGRAKSDEFVSQAVRYGVPRIMVIPNNFTKDGDKEEEFAVILKGMRYIAAKAKENGVKAMIEDYGGTDNPCSYSLYLRRFLKEIPELHYALDTGNLHYAGRGEDILEMMRFAEGRIDHVHLKDFQKGSNRIRITLGIGEIPNEEVVRTMDKKGYDAWYTLEDLVGDAVDDAYRQVTVVRRWCGALR